MNRVIAFIAILFLSVVGVTKPVFGSDISVLGLDPTFERVELEKNLWFSLDNGASLAVQLGAFRSAVGPLVPLTDIAQDMVPYQPVWAFMRISNQTPDDGRVGDTWFLTSGIYGLVGLDAFVIRDNNLTEQVMSFDINSRFSEADYEITRLRSGPISLAPGEEATLVAKLVFGPIMSESLYLETPKTLEAHAFSIAITAVAFYAFSLSCLVFFVGFSLSMRSGIGLEYGIMLVFGLLFIAYLDGHLFRFVYPDRPDFHIPIGLMVIYLLVLSGSLVAGFSTPFNQKATASNLSGRGLAAAAICSLLLLPFVAAEVLAPLSYVLLALMLIVNTGTILKWHKSEGNFVGVMRALSIFSAVLVSLMVIALFSGWAAITDHFGFWVKTFYAIIGLWIIFGISITLIDLRKQHAGAQKRELEAVRQEAQTSQDLLKAERAYSRAKDLAEKHQMQLATASHDFKQPIASLRMSVDSMGDNVGPELKSRLGKAFDYLETLSTEALANSEPSDEVFEANLIIETVARMFTDEAVSKGLMLKSVPSTLRVNAPILPVMRIVSNLTSNAVKYTHRGKVLIGARRHGKKVGVIIADTGPGMTPTELKNLRGAYQKGESSNGNGLGLAIIYELAEHHQFELVINSTQKKGTIFSLWIPRHLP